MTRSAEYVNLLRRPREGEELRRTSAESEVLVRQMDDAEFTAALRMLREHERVNPSPPGRLGGWDGRLHRAPYTDDGARRLHAGRFPRHLMRTLRAES